METGKRVRCQRALAAALSCLGMSVIASPACAQAPAAEQYPARPVRVVVPYAPGGANDILARTVVAKAVTDLGQNTLVENRAGGNTVIGTQFAARSAPDGYTLLAVDNAFTIGPSLLASLPYDTLKDFARVTMMTKTSPVLVVHPSVPAKSVKQLLALARARPGILTYGTTGNGTTAHLAFAQLKMVTGMDAVHVPYKGGALQITGLLSGEVSMLMSVPGPLLAHIKSGRMQPLAASGSKRLAARPDLPTLQESGVPVVVDSFWGLVAPAGTRVAIVNRLQEGISRVLAAQDMRARLEEMQFQVVGSTPAEFDAFVRSEVARWTGVVKATGVKVE